MSLKQSTVLKIENKVFLDGDISKLVRILAEQYKKRDKNDHHFQYLRMSIESDDNISYEADETNFSDILEIVQDKKITILKASYIDRKFDSTLSIKIEESDSSWTHSFVTIESENKSWFNATRTQMSDYLNSIQSHDNFYLTHKIMIKHLGRLIIGIPIFFIVQTILGVVAFALVGNHVITDPPMWLVTIANFMHDYAVILYLVQAYIWGFIFGDSLFKSIDRLWPTIEFNFGPSRKRTAANKRRVYSSFIGVVILPIITSLFFFLLPYFIK